MGEMMNEGQNLGNDIDLSQFYSIFFEEAGENLDQMEQMLLALDLEKADDEELNAIFRCAHSIKGGAATFGFADVAELTHQMESLLDKLRRHELTPTAAMVDVLLESSDALRGLLGAHQGRASSPPPRPTWSRASACWPTARTPKSKKKPRAGPRGGRGARSVAARRRPPHARPPRSSASWKSTSARWRTRPRPTASPSCSATFRAWARSRPCPAT